LAEGLVKGEARGETKGWKKRDKEAHREKLESARKMKQDGLPPKQIQKYTRLSPEEIERL
jgi:predicted transposase YdaD